MDLRGICALDPHMQTVMVPDVFSTFRDAFSPRLWTWLTFFRRHNKGLRSVELLSTQRALLPPTRRLIELSRIGSSLNRWASIKRRLAAMFGHFSPRVARIRYTRPTRNPTPDPTGDDTPPSASGVSRRRRVGDVGSTSALRRLDRRIRHRPLLRRGQPGALLLFPIHRATRTPRHSRR